MPDYIPAPDGEFDVWSANFTTKLVANPTNYGESALTVGTLTAAKTDWDAKYPAHQAAQSTAEATRIAKDASRASYVTAIRTIYKRLQASSAVDNTERVDLGMTVRDDVPTAVAAPASRPVLLVDTHDRLRHTINFADEGTPTSRAKPAGAAGVEIWVKIGGAPPTDVSECEYLATDTRSPYIANYSGSEGGQMAHYMARWVSTRHEPGPWSETASATIGA